jgi:hypothetical protein
VRLCLLPLLHRLCLLPLLHEQALLRLDLLLLPLLHEQAPLRLYLLLLPLLHEQALKRLYLLLLPLLLHHSLQDCFDLLLPPPLVLLLQLLLSPFLRRHRLSGGRLPEGAERAAEAGPGRGTVDGAYWRQLRHGERQLQQDILT